jgi:hypothetical protein
MKLSVIGVGLAGAIYSCEVDKVPRPRAFVSRAAALAVEFVTFALAALIPDTRVAYSSIRLPVPALRPRWAGHWQAVGSIQKRKDFSIDSNRGIYQALDCTMQLIARCIFAFAQPLLPRSEKR